MVEARIYSDEVIKVSYTPILYNEVCTVANQEYKKFLGACFKFTLKARGGTINIAFQPLQSNKTFISLSDGVSYNEDLIKSPQDFMLYFQSPTAGAILEIIGWR